MSSETHLYLDKVLGYIAQERFGYRNAPQVRLSPETHEDSDGSMTGALEISIRTRNGQDVLIQRQAFEGLKSTTEIDDLLANTLSVLLMNHMEWPR